MARISYVNGRYVHHHEAMVHIEDRGYQFADGVYEYIAFYNGIALDGLAHLKRFWRSMAELEIAPPMTMTAMQLVIRELIRRNGRDDGGLYIQVTRGVARRDHVFPGRKVKAALVMTVCGPKLAKPQDIAGGVRAVTMPDIRWDRRDIKSISLLGNVLSRQAAARVQAREAWLVDDGVITEGSASNTYIITKKGELMTAPADHHILGGIVRDVVLELARKNGIPVIERAFTPEQAKDAAEAFITSTSANVLPVVKLDEARIGDGRVGPVTKKLQALYVEHIYQNTGKRF